MNLNLNSVGGRRFLLTQEILILSTLLQLFGKMDHDGGSYAMIMLGTVGAYIAGATFQAVKTPVKTEE